MVDSIALVFSCFGTGRAQGKSDEVIAKLEQAMKVMEPEWRCVREYTPQGEPGPESPRGTTYRFRCQHRAMALSILIFYGDTENDAEKVLALSQNLQVNESKRWKALASRDISWLRSVSLGSRFERLACLCKLLFTIELPRRAPRLPTSHWSNP